MIGTDLLSLYLQVQYILCDHKTLFGATIRIRDRMDDDLAGLRNESSRLGLELEYRVDLLRIAREPADNKILISNPT